MVKEKWRWRFQTQTFSALNTVNYFGGFKFLAFGIFGFILFSIGFGSPILSSIGVVEFCLANARIEPPKNFESNWKTKVNNYGSRMLRI
jgi:hypothetical protein